MKLQSGMKWLAGAALLGAVAASGQRIVINEIMYHPTSEDVREEYIELYNAGPTNVSLAGWRVTGGIEFAIPGNPVLLPNDYLVLAANGPAFQAKYPAVDNFVAGWAVRTTTNVVGRTLTNWAPVLSNSRNTLELLDAASNRVDRVTYADEGDWAIRQRGPNDALHRGWIWYKEHDGLGKSLELMNPAFSNEFGQNWEASTMVDGTPGSANSVFAGNVAPLIVEAIHAPIVPRSTDTLSVTARILDELGSNVTATLFWRVDAGVPPPFNSTNLLDDGLHADGVAGDGVFGALLPPQANNAVIEYYIAAADQGGAARTWPRPAIAAADGAGPTGQVANALFQVDNAVYTGSQPLYKIIMTEAERVELAGIPGMSTVNGPNSQMNATFIGIDGAGTECRYLLGVRNRGHGSRTANPPNYRLNFRSDEPWKGAVALNVNSRQVHIQVLGNVLAQKAGLPGANSRPVNVRVNNENRAQSGAPMYGSYAANEVYDGDWSDRQLPFNSGGNVYQVVRDLPPTPNPRMDYRGATNYGPYTNTYVKQTHASQNDWIDLINMLDVMATNGTAPYTTANVRQVINVEQWLRHLAVMSIFGNQESGLNTGNNDDYYMYRGVTDPRFILMHHDLDQILGIQSFPPNSEIFRATGPPISGDTEGSMLLMNRFLHTPEFETLYYQTHRDLLNSTFFPEQFNQVVDQALGGWVPGTVISGIKLYNRDRRNYILSILPTNLPPAAGQATITGEPRSPTPSRNATLLIGGAGISNYNYRVNSGPFVGIFPVATPIVLTNLAHNTTNTVYVIGQSTNGAWQSSSAPTVSRTWIVRTNWPAVRLSEVLARNDAAVNHEGTFPDLIELHNEGAATVNLGGMRLTDDPAVTNKFTFPSNTMLLPGERLVLYANDPDGTSGLHLGFALAAEGDGVFLYDAMTNGGALLDSVQFGLQLPDRSIARVNGGSWSLALPTFGGANSAVSLGSQQRLRFNEWLPAGAGAFPDDFIELLNLDLLPVEIGGLFLTDNFIGRPGRHQIPPLSFVAANAYQVLIADGNTDAGADHVGFGLEAEQGQLTLHTLWGTMIDCVTYGPAQPGVSFGRCPSGGTNFAAQAIVTPNAPNSCPFPSQVTNVASLVFMSNVWRYEQSGADQGTAWREPGFNDAAWPQGQAAMATPQSLPETVRTALTANTNKTTFYFRTAFVPASTNGVTLLQLNHITDDGAVFYLNGREVGRFNMPSGTISNGTLASANINTVTIQGPINISPTNLVTGTNVLAVEVHQRTTSSPDVAFAARLDAIIVTNIPRLLINEVFADNATYFDPDGSTPDWVELFNGTGLDIDLSDMSLTDNPTNARRWVIPIGTLLPSMSYYTARLDADRPASATNAGFGLKRSGDRVYLYSSVASGMTNVDSVVFGIQVADFSLGRMPNGTGPWTLTLPTVGGDNLAASLGDPGALIVNEWFANPIPGQGDDWFEMYNPASQPIALGGLWLTDNLADYDNHQIAALSFIGVSSNAWQRFEADNNVSAGADHVGFGLRAQGESIGIFTASGFQLHGITFGAQLEDVSEGRLPDGAPGPFVKFPGTASPGDPNYVNLTNVVINEVLTHTDAPLEDAIELRNVTGAPLNIGRWYLSDSRSNPRKFQIPPGTMLNGQSFRVFYEYEFNSPDAIVPFALSSGSSDEVYLSAATVDGFLTGHRASVSFGAAENGVSFGRHQTTVGVDFVALSERTFGQDNPSSLAEFRAGGGATNAYPRVGPIVISEIMFHPPDVVPIPGVTNDNTLEEFIELHNLSDCPVPLYDVFHPTNGWRLRDAVDFDFNTNHAIVPGGYLIVVGFDPATNAAALAAFRAKYGTNSTLAGPWSGKLDNSGESIELKKPDAPGANGGVPYVLVEQINYKDRAPWSTNADGSGRSLHRLVFSRYGNEPTNWVDALPGPGPSGDMDGDDMSDSWEMLHSFNKNSPADALLDADNDGVSNLDEFRSGTHPRLAADHLRVVSATVTNGQAFIQFIAVAGKTYTLLGRDSLDDGDWTWVANVPAPVATGMVQLVDPSVAGNHRFYRLVTPAMPPP